MSSSHHRGLWGRSWRGPASSYWVRDFPSPGLPVPPSAHGRRSPSPAISTVAAHRRTSRIQADRVRPACRAAAVMASMSAGVVRSGRNFVKLIFALPRGSGKNEKGQQPLGVFRAVAGPSGRFPIVGAYRWRPLARVNARSLYLLPENTPNPHRAQGVSPDTARYPPTAASARTLRSRSPSTSACCSTRYSTTSERWRTPATWP